MIKKPERSGRLIRSTLFPAAFGAALLLMGCAQDAGPMWGPNSPRNGADQPVDPVYGTPIPGYPTTNAP